MPRYAPEARLRVFSYADSVQQAAWEKRNLARAYREVGDVVYFIRRNGFIKIGHSKNLRDRIAALGVQPTDLICLVPGGEEREAEMHERFAHLRVDGSDLGREHFRLDAELLEYVNDVRQGMGLDAVA